MSYFFRYLSIADQWLTRASKHHAANEVSMGQTAALIGTGWAALAQACISADIGEHAPLTLWSRNNPDWVTPSSVAPGQGPTVAAPMTTTAPEVTQ